MLLNRLTGSLAFRLPALYKQLLRLKRTNVSGNRPLSNNVIIMMTGKNFIGMTRLSILSIARSWTSLPKLIINTDGTITPADVLKRLNFWPGEIEVETWNDIEAYHLQKNRIELARYGNAHPFGKKLAAILKHADISPVIWIDSDILFFNNFLPFIPETGQEFACGGTEDVGIGYHEAVIKLTGTDLYNLYKFNAGMLYVSGKNIYDQFGLENLISSIYPNFDFCTEQTIFAHIASKSMGVIWPREVIKSYNSDVQQIRAMPKKDVIARHYTSNVRHLFWRDAFFNL